MAHPALRNPESPLSGQVPAAVKAGLKKGWAGLIWLVKILVPISFATALMVHYQLLHHLDFFLQPMMSIIHLPASAAIVLVIGVFTGIYGTVAALSVMHFSMAHMILIAVFTLISHNLIQESMVQAQSGLRFSIAVAFRLAMSFIVTMICGWIMGVEPGSTGPVGLPVLHGAKDPLSVMLMAWATGTGRLCLKIFCIIMTLMVVMELARVFRIIEAVTRMAAPVLRLLGLDRSCALLWMTAAVFGLAYGAAVIVEETKNNTHDPETLTRLHLSIGINHAMIEDPSLFLPLGLPAFWLWVPRLVAAMAAAWLHMGFSSARRFYAARPGHKKFCDH
ncbi:iron transporter [uncultured Desulfobacter sp.]|uniref:iron transporter n=1 Tax=uncultured Desulfobacter sp. TaxID=240139 RepID=UPI002AAACA12|nr:iron transporter [uncultured Desulfobacter sp.]